jgi:hypothetical protein
VTGTVSSGDSVLPAATVQLKGTHVSSVTDEDGKFTISAPPGGTLVFSHIGFATRELKISRNPVINVQLQSTAQQLGDVVVV